MRVGSGRVRGAPSVCSCCAGVPGKETTQPARSAAAPRSSRVSATTCCTCGVEWGCGCSMGYVRLQPDHERLHLWCGCRRLQNRRLRPGPRGRTAAFQWYPSGELSGEATARRLVPSAWRSQRVGGPAPGGWSSELLHHQEAASRKLRHGCVHQGVQLRPGSYSIARLGSGTISSLLKWWLDGDGSGGSGGGSVGRLDVARWPAQQPATLVDCGYERAAEECGLVVR